MKPLIDLNRRLLEVEGLAWNDTDIESARALGTLQTWSDVLRNQCSILVGSANSGKTSEFRLQATALRKAGAHACFVAVRELMEGGRLEDALESEEARAFRTWLAVPGEKLYLFVDSLDEATISSPRHLRNALRNLVERVSVSSKAVTWALSTRPIVLNQDVIDAIDDALGVAVSRLVDPAIPSSRVAGAGGAKTSTKLSTEIPKVTAKVFRLAPLSRPQARIFLQDALGLAHASHQIEAAVRYGLEDLLRSPGKCKLLHQLDLLETPPTSLEETYRRSLSAHLNAPTSGRSKATKATKEQLETEAARLACASTLCERLNIELPSESEEPSPQALSARALVRGLSDSDLSYLLTTDFFGESGHQQVKLQPDDMRFYLGARRLSELIRGREDARKIAQLLGWRAPTGERGIFIPFIPLAGWLATLNRDFRLECLELDSQCVAFFGDLRSLPVLEAQEALTAAVRRIAEGHRVGRGAYHLTAENYWQAGGPLLLPHISSLFDEQANNEAVRELLLDIAKTVHSGILRNQAFAWADSNYLRIVEDVDLLAYFLAADYAEDRRLLCEAALTLATVPPRSLRLLIRSCAWTILNGTAIAKLVKGALSEKNDNFSLDNVLRHEVVTTASDDNLVELTRHLLGLLTSRISPGTEGGTRRQLRRDQWLAEVISEYLARLAERELDAAIRNELAALIVQFQLEVLDKDNFSTIDIKSLCKVLENPGSLRDEVILQLVPACKSFDEPELWHTFLRQSIVLPTLEEIRKCDAPLIAKVIADYSEMQKSRSAQAEQSAHVASDAITESTKAELLKHQATIEEGTDIDALAWVAQFLSSTNGMARYGEIDLSEFKAVYGDEIATAVAHGLKKFWRAYAPRRDDKQTNSVYWSTIAGLQGLHLEFTENATYCPATKEELRRALDYGLYEINGLPTWYWHAALTDVDESAKFLRETVQSASTGPASTERAARVITSLPDAPLAIQEALAPEAWSAVSSGQLDEYQTNVLLSLLVEKRLVAVDLFNQAAQRQVFENPASPLAATWALHWMMLDAPMFIANFETARQNSSRALDSLITAIAVALEDNRRPSLQELSRSTSAAVNFLKTLHLELLRVFPREGDRKRPAGRFFVYDDRESAQRIRDRLPALLATAGTSAGYMALKELRELTTNPDERYYFQTLMYQTSESMQRRSRPMTEEEYLDFERTLIAAPDSLDAFAQQVENDILDVRDIVEKGEFSPRRFLASSVQDVEAGVVKAMEDEFQLFLAGHLALLGRQRYSVFREPQGSDDTRRDISIAHPARGWKATLELKVTEGGWTVEDYRNSLRNQLVGLYMRERHTSVGFFVVLRQSSRTWVVDDKRLDYDGLLEILRADALQLEAEQPRLRLRVMGIDATEPLNPDGSIIRAKAAPRAEKAAKQAAKKVTKKTVKKAAKKAVKKTQYSQAES